MDKSRDMRRGTGRFSRQQNNTNKPQQSRPNLFFGKFTLKPLPFPSLVIFFHILYSSFYLLIRRKSLVTDKWLCLSIDFEGFDGGGGDYVCLEKAKKEKIRRLSSVNGNRGSPSHCPNSNQHCETEMGSCCCDSNRENQCPHSQHSSSLITNSTTERFKIPEKVILLPSSFLHTLN